MSRLDLIFVARLEVKEDLILVSRDAVLEKLVIESGTETLKLIIQSKVVVASCRRLINRDVGLSVEVA